MSKRATAKDAAPKKKAGKTAGKTTGKKVAAEKAAPAVEPPPTASRGRAASDPFYARKRGATDPEIPEDDPEVAPGDFEPVELGDPDSDVEGGRLRKVLQQRMQQELDEAPFARHLGLRLQYAEHGVSRIHLPAESGNTEPGPLEGGIVGAICVAAGHFAAASIAPGVGIRLVEYKLNILGVVQGDLLAIGEVVRKGRTLVASRIEIVEDNDRVVAAGLATYLLQQA